ncbi:hypothetical protein CS022_24375, partial [Veronia nyctiphanis]
MDGLHFYEGEGKSFLSHDDIEFFSSKIAIELSKKIKKGETAILIYPAGIEFVLSFLACIKAGIIAVPINPPRKNQKINRFSSICEDSSAKHILTTSEMSSIYRNILTEGEGAKENQSFIDTDTLKNNKTPLDSDYHLTFVDAIEKYSNNVAYLQYTSGSTGDPKGVCITYKNLKANIEGILDAVGRENRPLSWLPHFHDMGLVAGICLSIYAKFDFALFSPTEFVAKPARWLRIISEFKATLTMQPNFAFQHCLNNVDENSLVDIDLSTWNVASNGAEPIDYFLLEEFTKRYQKLGFKASTHRPCFGLAEATLAVTHALDQNKIRHIYVDKSELKNDLAVLAHRDNGQVLVSCGPPINNHRVEIVDPTTFEKCGERAVGEIWFSGPSAAVGYWKNHDATQETFKATPIDEPQTCFMRTGDLGFMHEGELYVCGRLKDMIVIRGQNFYPQDLEQIASRSHQDLAAGNCAAFGIERDGREHVVIVLEVKRTALKRLDVKAVLSSVVKAISDAFEISLHDIVLIKPARVLKTSSGKIQRSANKRAYINGEFNPVGSLSDEEIKQEPSEHKTDSEAILCAIIEEVLSIKNVSINDDFFQLGGDSISAITFTTKVREKLGIDISLETLFEKSSVNALMGSKHSDAEECTSLNAEPDKQHIAFPLNDIQYAYWVGQQDSQQLG